MTQTQTQAPTALAPIPQVLFTSNGGLLKSKFRMHFGRLELTPTQIVWFQRSNFWMMFGALGVLLSRRSAGKRTREIELRTIAKAARGKHGLNKKILDVTLTDGTTVRFAVDKFDDMVARLRELGCTVDA